MHFTFSTPVRIWAYPDQAYLTTHLGGIQLTNVDTGEILYSPQSTYNKSPGAWQLITDTIPAGTYKIEDYGQSRIDAEWKFEKMQ
jgi:hypothetical protein